MHAGEQLKVISTLDWKNRNSKAETLENLIIVNNFVYQKKYLSLERLLDRWKNI